MKSAPGNKPTHIVKGNIFDALGFSASEASALKIKAEILSAILEHVQAKGYTQAQLVDILDEYQPSVSSLLKGRISQVSIEKLLRYADRLHLQTSIAVRPIEGGKARCENPSHRKCATPRAETGSGRLACFELYNA
jgi:predicted XRE-type DNA-binding protein